MQAQTTGRLRDYRHIRIILGVVIGIGLAAVILFGALALTDGEGTFEGQQLSPVNIVMEDPPLPEGWVDSYFNQPIVIPAETDPPLPEGWVDPYFNPPAAIPDQQDPPLPEGWVDPYFQGH